ncbi:MAG TPA: carboxypeptidase regulatory-like domain-containing protein [Candidatus Glassbacteria bacterium]|nr:carboxypeptidase regulatory-like domain-containing protein [Candidatus Glassbacteria bacterium]
MMIREPFALEVKDKSIKLSEMPVRGDTIKVTFGFVPKETKKGLRVIFYEFSNTRPVTDTVFYYNAQEGKKISFSIDVIYFSTPAIIRVKITNSKGRPNGLSIYRYLLDAKTGQYGTRKDVQFTRPLEYCFNTKKGGFEYEIVHLKPERWRKNRAIIDSIQEMEGGISDSMALVLYSEIPKIEYPKTIIKWKEKAQYLLREGWKPQMDEEERNAFLARLSQKIQEKERQETRGKQWNHNKVQFLCFLRMYIPAMVLIAVLILLFMLRKRIFPRAYTSTKFNIFVRYLIYALILGIAIFCIYGYLFRDKRIERRKKLEKVEKIEKENQKILEKILQVEELSRYSDYPMVYKSVVGSKYGTGAIFRYKDTIHSGMNIDYHFLVRVYPGKDSVYRIVHPDYDLDKIITNFEKDEQVKAFINKLHIKKLNLQRRGALLLATTKDTIIKGNSEYPINFQYNFEKGLVTGFSIPAYFTDAHFPEIDTLKKRCRNAGYPAQNDKCIKYEYQYSSYGRPRKRKRFSALVKGGGSDTLRMWFAYNKPKDIGYKWIPVPKRVTPPDKIIEQVYGELKDAGLPYDYIRNHLKIVSSTGRRTPDYFKGIGDRVVLDTEIKWNTGYEWVDASNKGKGIRLFVSYEYFSDENKLGNVLAKPGCRGKGRWKNKIQKRYFLKPITNLIPENEAREKLFSTLPQGNSFSSIYIGVNIPEEKEKLKNFIYLVGTYYPRGYRYLKISIKVNLETGEILLPSNFFLGKEPPPKSSYKVKYQICNECTTGGKIQGKVLDKLSGEPLPFCIIRFPDLEKTIGTDLLGEFSLESIPPGRYEVKTGLLGYSPITAESIFVEIGKTAVIEFKLSVQWPSRTIEIMR